MRYLDYLSPLFQGMKAFNVNGEVIDGELGSLETAIADLKNDQYIDTLTMKGVARREKMLGIVPLDTDTLEDRRFRIYARENKEIPYTKETVVTLLESLCGADNYRFSIDYETFTVTVRINLIARPMMEEVRATLEDIVPLNMVLDIDILYNDHDYVSQFTHEYLSNYTHQQIREDVL